MLSTVIQCALGEFDRQLEQLRDVRRQLEAEETSSSYRGGGWEEPREVLPHLLNQLYETLLVVLEVADLPQTRERLLQEWDTFNKKPDGIGTTVFYPQYDYLESKPLSHLEVLIDGLRIAAGQGIKTAEAFELTKLESILRRTGVLLWNRGMHPQRELDVQNVMHEYLEAFFTEYRHPIHITGILRNFEPDGGVRNLQAAIEFKYASSKAEVATALTGIFEDINGYKGSRDWTRFYTVVYQTQSFEAEDRFKAELTRVGSTWTPIIVTGGGTRQQKSTKRATKKK